MKRFVISMIIFLAVFSLNAKPEFWLGTSSLADRNMISDEVKFNFPNFNGGNIKHIKALGPGFEVSFFHSLSLDWVYMDHLIRSFLLDI